MVGERKSFERPDGKQVAAYRADPPGKSRGAIAVIHEWYGLTPDIERIGDRFANAGYTAVCPDLYRGQVASGASQAQMLMTKLDGADAVQQDIRGVVQSLVKEGQ